MTLAPLEQCFLLFWQTMWWKGPKCMFFLMFSFCWGTREIFFLLSLFSFFYFFSDPQTLVSSQSFYAFLRFFFFSEVIHFSLGPFLSIWQRNKQKGTKNGMQNDVKNVYRECSGKENLEKWWENAIFSPGTVPKRRKMIEKWITFCNSEVRVPFLNKMQWKWKWKMK